jgi:hypothetical protein
MSFDQLPRHQRIGFILPWSVGALVTGVAGIAFAAVGEIGWALFGFAAAASHLLVLAAGIKYGRGTISNVRRFLNDVGRSHKPS